MFIIFIVGTGSLFVHQLYRSISKYTYTFHKQTPKVYIIRGIVRHQPEVSEREWAPLTAAQGTMQSQ